MKGILNLFKDIWLGLVLILASSSLLLVSDLGRRGERARPSNKAIKLAIMQWAATDLLDSTVGGIVEGLRKQGFEEGPTVSLRMFNASGDSASGNMMARELVSGAYDMIFTASTLALQAVAAANREGRVRHLFAAVTDPYGAGVGIKGPKPEDRPPHLLGIGTFQPVANLFRTAKMMNRALEKVGVVWSPAEDNSAACLGKARQVCRELGIELFEANAGNTSEVPEALRSLLSREVDAIWIGGDTVAISAINGILAAAHAEGVPVMTNDPGDTAKGALLSLGAAYATVGEALGEMGGRILRGEEMGQFGVEDHAPELLTINEALLPVFAGWTLNEDLKKAAEKSKGAVGVRASALPIKPNRPYRIRIVRYNDAQFSLETLGGIMAGFKEAGLEEGRDLEFRSLSAQGDMSTLSSIVSSVMTDDPDLIMPISTPALQAVLRQSSECPVIFSSVADAVRAGAGESEISHLANVTGITTRSPFDEMAELIREVFPRAKKVGTLFTPAEVNSEIYRSWFEEALEKKGIELVAVPVSSSAETAEATGVLLRTGIELIAQIADNATRPGYAQIIRRASDEGVAFFSFDSAGMKDGAALALARDYFHTGREAAQVALRVLKGESPQFIPFANTKTQVLLVNSAVLKSLGLHLPDAIMTRATPYLE